MTDALSEIAQERDAAQAAKAAAERLMTDSARDPAAFRKARRERDAAVEALERLEWAERAEHERQEQAKLQAKVDALREAQQQACEAYELAKMVAVEVNLLTDTLVEKVKELQTAQGALERGVRYEQFGVRDGYLERQTLKAQIAIDVEQAVRIIRAGRELAILSGLPARVAEERAAQGKL